MRYLLLSILLMSCSVSADPIVPKSGQIAKFGQVVEIEGQIIDGSETRIRQYEGVKLLEVTSVGGRKLSKPKKLRFQWHDLAEESELSGKVKLAVFETGAFEGIPDRAFDYVPRAATTPFAFDSYLSVLKKLDK